MGNRHATPEPGAHRSLAGKNSLLEALDIVDTGECAGSGYQLVNRCGFFGAFEIENY